MNKLQLGGQIVNYSGEVTQPYFQRLRPCRILPWVLILAIFFPSLANAHRGTDEIDVCRIRVGEEWVHFSAYTPKFTGNKSYCSAIPDIGVANLVFDYEGKKLRNAEVEFEVTKEPEGTRVYYRAPAKSKTGTVDGTVDFSPLGPGDYRAHVTLVQGDEKFDAHVPFSVGEGDVAANSPIVKFLVTALVSVVIIFLTVKIANAKGSKDSA